MYLKYRMQQCAIDNIADITVFTEQGILKINVVYIFGKKERWKMVT